jgi:hypothetical protein
MVDVCLILHLLVTGSWLPGTTEAATLGQLNDKLIKGIADLEKFTRHVGEFATWWTCMKMDTGAQYERSQKIAFKYDSLRERSVIDRWRNLKQRFVTYHVQV